MEFSELEIFLIFEIEYFWNFPNCEFLGFIVEIRRLTNFSNYFNSENQILALRISNFGIVRPFDIAHSSKFCQFLYLPFDMNQFSHFLFSIVVTRTSKIARSIFERP